MKYIRCIYNIHIFIYNYLPEGCGVNWKGHYPTSMLDATSKALTARPYDMSFPTKIGVVIAEYINRHYQNKFYGKAQNLTQSLTRAYDDALEKYDVLIMPTLPSKAFPLPTEKDSIASKC